MNISNFKKTVKNIPADIAVLLRAGTGVGKSHIVGDLAKNHYKLPLIDVRGSTMSEGDAGGYPDIEAMKENGIMTFCMPSWFIRACNEPVVLFLDEVNRSLPGVQQSFFQLVLDRQLGNDANGNPYTLHPETRVFAAVNHGAEYDVNEMDPALLRRFWVCDLENTKDDWISYARENDHDPLLIEFLNKNSAHLRVDTSTVESGTVVPTNASWSRFDQTLKCAGIDLKKIVSRKSNRRTSMIYNLALGFVGKEAAIEFTDFIKKYEISLSVEDIIDRYDEVLDTIKSTSNDRINALIDQIGEHCKSNEWTVSQAENVSKLARFVSEEMLIHMWSVVSSTKKLKNIQKFHKFIGQHIVDVVKKSKEDRDN